MSDAAVLGYPQQCRQPVERYNPLYPSGMAGKAATETGRLRARRRFRARIQRGVFVAAMDISVIAFLALLLAVGILRIFELGVSRRHQRQMAADGATKVNEPQFRWMVFVHTAVLIGAALEVVLLRRPLDRKS